MAVEGDRYQVWLEFARGLEDWQWVVVARAPGLSETALEALLQARREKDDARLGAHS